MADFTNDICLDNNNDSVSIRNKGSNEYEKNANNIGNVELDKDFHNIGSKDNNKNKIIDNSIGDVGYNEVVNDTGSNKNTNNLEKLRKTRSYVNYSACNDEDNSDDTDKDPDYCYNTTNSENSEDDVDIFIQSRSTQSNNTTQNSLETSLNVTGQKICDDINLYVESSKPKGAGKQNFCYYCKKMQSKISRHLEQVHKNEEDVKKFTILPIGTQNISHMLFKVYILL